MNEAQKGQTAIYHTHIWTARRFYTFLLLLLLLAILILNVQYMQLIQKDQKHRPIQPPALG